MNSRNHSEVNIATNIPSTFYQKEIDLFELLGKLFLARHKIILSALVCIMLGVAFSAFTQNWTSKSVVTPPESTQWNELRHALARLHILGVDVNVAPGEEFYSFIKKLQSQSLLEEYLKTSPYVLEKIKDTDPVLLHKTVVSISEKMKSASNDKANSTEKIPYESWTLSFTAKSAENAQRVLQDYIDWISALVRQDTLQNISNALELKKRVMKEQLDIDYVLLTNAYKTNIQRLNYSLEVAHAAGIKQPVYSHGLAVKDDPDYSVSLGSNGIARKLQIEESLKDATELNTDYHNRSYLLEQLQNVELNEVSIPPLKYQMLPSLPVKKDGPGMIIIALIAAITGVGISSFAVLLRESFPSHWSQRVSRGK